MKKPISSTLLFFLVLFSVNAQNSITGTITDAYKIYLPFANIILHKQGGDELPKGVISDDDGAYVFEKIPNGNYQLEISTNQIENYVQLYTPENLPLIAIEPMTGVSNSFNNSIGLRVLLPNRSYSLKWNVKIK